MSDEREIYEAVAESECAWHEAEILKAGESAVADDILSDRDRHYRALTTNWLTELHDTGAPVWHVPGYAGDSREAKFVNRLVNIQSRDDAKAVVNPRDLMPVWGPRVLREAGKRAALKRHPINLTDSDMLWLVWRSKGLCELSGLPFDMTKRGGGEWRPFTPSIDRISSSKGYSFGNVRLVTLVANVAMNGWGEEPLLRLAEALVQRRGEASEQFRNSNRNTIRNTSETKGEKKGAKSLKNMVPRDGVEPPTLRFSVELILLIFLTRVTKFRDLQGGRRERRLRSAPHARTSLRDQRVMVREFAKVGIKAGRF